MGINNMKIKQCILLIAIALSAFPAIVLSQTSECSLRSSMNLEWRITKGLKIEIAPQYRFNPGPTANEFLLQAGLDCRVASWLSIGGSYRLDGEKIQDPESDNGSAFNLSNRFALDANTKASLKRFTPKFRLRLCNFTDFNSLTDDKSNYLRYRFGLDYNIKGIKLTPFAAVEFYQKLSTGLFGQTRCTIGGEYEFNKKNAIAVSYSYARKYKTAATCHIFELSYNVKF